jgi:hypothetical protein
MCSQQLVNRYEIGAYISMFFVGSVMFSRAFSHFLSLTLLRVAQGRVRLTRGTKSEVEQQESDSEPWSGLVLNEASLSLVKNLHCKRNKLS